MQASTVAAPGVGSVEAVNGFAVTVGGTSVDTASGVTGEAGCCAGPAAWVVEAGALVCAVALSLCSAKKCAAQTTATAAACAWSARMSSASSCQEGITLSNTFQFPGGRQLNCFGECQSALTGRPMRLGVGAYGSQNTLLVAVANDVIAERSNVRVVGLRRI